MKPTTEKFIVEVMDSLKYTVNPATDDDIFNWSVIDGLEGYEGNGIDINFDIAGGMINITVTNGNKASEQKFLMFEDEEKMDIDQTAANLEEMVQDLITKENEEPVEEPVDYNEKLGFDGIYGTEEETVEEPVEPSDVKPCKAYLDKDGTVVLLFDEEANEDGDLAGWAAGEPFTCDPYYCDELEELAKSDPSVIEAATAYEDLSGKKLFILPIGEDLDVQKFYHKDIQTLD